MPKPVSVPSDSALSLIALSYQPVASPDPDTDLAWFRIQTVKAGESLATPALIWEALGQMSKCSLARRGSGVSALCALLAALAYCLLSCLV